jgi:hypothetical protein
MGHSLTRSSLIQLFLLEGAGQCFDKEVNTASCTLGKVEV